VRQYFAEEDPREQILAASLFEGYMQLNKVMIIDGHAYASDLVDNLITTFHSTLYSSRKDTVNLNREILTEEIVNIEDCAPRIC
jgi:hypothetical protein